MYEALEAGALPVLLSSIVPLREFGPHHRIVSLMALPSANAGARGGGAGGEGGGVGGRATEEDADAAMQDAWVLRCLLCG